MAPKAGKKGVVPAAVEATEDPFVAPEDVPEACPFEIEWNPALFVVQMGQGLDEMSIKKRLLAAQSCKCMHMMLETNNAEASPEPTELKASIQKARSELAPGAVLPPDILLQLCELRWSTDRETGWQKEWVRRQEACQGAVSAFEAAEASVVESKAKLEESASALVKGIALQQECGVVLTTDSEGVPHTDVGEPCEPLVPLWNAEQDAKSAFAAAEANLTSCKEQLEELTTGQNNKWCKTQLYWTKGLGVTADELRSLLQASIPVVAAVNLHSAAQPSGEAATVEGEDPLIFQTVRAEHEAAAWDDIILQIAAIDVLTGSAGGQFVNQGVYDNTEKDSANGDEIEGAHEMVAALKRLAECLPAYRSWKAEHSLLRLPDVPVELAHYNNLLDTVPPEQQSIAVVLHCLVEQVACSSNGLTGGNSDSIEARKGLNFMNAALRNVADPELFPASAPTETQQVATIMEGDLPQMASHGLLTGLVKVAENKGSTNASSQEDALALMPDGALNIPAVESRMARTLWSQWQQFARPTDDDTIARVKESMLQASAVQAGVDWSAMQLFNRIQEAADVLPLNSRTLHHAELLQRHHAIDFSVTGTVARVCHSMQSLPQHEWGSMQIGNDRILVCHGGCVRQDATVNIPHYVPQAEFVNQYLSTAPAYSMPSMSRIVYPVSPQGSTVRKNAVNAYLSNGTWVQAARDGCAKMSCGSAQLNIFTGGKPQVVVHGLYGLHAVFFMHEVEKTAKAAIEPGALEQAVVDPQPPADTESQEAASEGKEASEPPSADSSRPATPLIRTLTVLTPMACGKLAIMHTEGILVFRGSIPTSAASGQQWFAVFSDGSFVVTKDNGDRILRFSDGSTCEKVAKEFAGEGASGDARIDWISTMHDGKRRGITLPDAVGSKLETAENGSAEVPEAAVAALVVEAPEQLVGDVHELEQVPHSVSIDAEVKAVTTTRDDNTMHISYQTGESVVMWQDGCRTTSWSDGSWVVEIPGLPCVHGRPDKMLCEVAPEAELAWHRDSAFITLKQGGVCSVLSCPDGTFAGSLHCTDGQMQAGAQEMLLQKDDTWDLEAAARQVPRVVVGDLTSGNWEVQDYAEQGHATAVGFDGSVLHGFEPSLVSAPEVEKSEDDTSAVGQEEVSDTRPQDDVNPAAVNLPPRVFIIDEKGTSMEILPKTDYEAYSAHNGDKQGVTDTMDKIPGTGITLHRFVKEREEVTSTVQPLLVAEGAVVSSPEVSRAISALKVPCQSYLRPCAGLMLPRVAAPSQQITSELDVKPLLLLFKEFLVYSTTGKDAETFLELHKQCDEQLQQMNAEKETTQSASQELAASAQQQSLIARLRGLELDAAERAKELAKQHESEQMKAVGRNIMREHEALLQKAGDALATSKVYRAWEPTMGEFEALTQLPQQGQVLQYFACEDGIKALRSHDLQHNSGAQEYEKLQERLRNMPPSSHFAERGIYGVVDHVQGPDDSVEEQQQHHVQTWGEESPDANMYHGMHQASAESAEQRMNDTGLDTTDPGSGQESSRVKLPKIYRQPKVGVLNDEYLKVEYMTKRLVKTSAAELIRARGRDDVEFDLGCDVLDFGQVKLGELLVRRIPLHNVSLERARFMVERVEPPLKVTYQRGPVPAGLKTHLLVEFHPEPYNTELGQYENVIVVRSPVNVLKCRVCACVSKSE